MVEGSSPKGKASLNWSKIRNVVFGSNSTGSLSRLKHLLVEPGGEDEISHGKETKTFTHGIKLLRKISINYAQDNVAIEQVLFCDLFKCHMILFADGNICRYNENGEQEIFCCKERILSFCFVVKFKTYITVCADNNIRILDKDLVLINVIPYSGTIHGISLNTFTQEIITYGTGSLIVWLFRTSGTLLIPKLVISDKISPRDNIIDIAIERTSSEEQRCFSIVKNGVLVHKLGDGTCIQRLTGIHDSIITKVLYFQPLKLLITSSKDGCIKSWKEDGSLHCIFVGHSAEITSISLFPFGHKIISTSNDGTIRTWSLDSNCETDCHKLNAIVYGVGTVLGVDSFFSFTKNVLYLWQVNNLHLPFVLLRRKVNLIKMTTNPKLPPVSFCICDDGCVCIICPVKGVIVTHYVAPKEVSLTTDAVYHLSENLLIMLRANGEIIGASTTTNPCCVKYTWDKEATTGCTSISLYEYMPESSSDDDQWKEINNKTFSTHMDNSSDKTLLFGGCKDGTIVVFQWMEGNNNGSIVFTLQAHKSEVTAMTSNPKLDQLASTSKDKSLKIWRVFPFAEEALTPLLLFEHSMPIHGMVFSNKSLCVIYQDMVRAYHTIGMYKTSHNVKERCVAQDIMKDHTDEILCITACPKLQLVASSSQDGEVHIRNTENELITILKLNDVAHSVSFSSQRGNLLLAIGTNIHIIDYKQYLPSRIIQEMIGIKFVDCEEVPMIDVNEGLLSSSVDNSVPSVKSRSYLHFVVSTDVISDEEKARREEKQRTKESACSILQARDNELNLIKEGKLRAKRYAPQSSLDRDIAFQRYLDLFYKRPNIPYPEDDDMGDDDDRFIVKMDSSYRPPDDENGFFSVPTGKNDIEKIKAKIRKCREDEQQQRKLIGSKSDLELPGKKIRSLSIETDKVDIRIKERPGKPPLSASTTYVERLNALKKINQQFGEKRSVRIGKFLVSSNEYPLNAVTKTDVNKQSVKKFKETLYEDESSAEALPIAPDGILPNSVIVALYKELIRESVDEGLKDWKPAELTADQLEEINKFNAKKVVKKIETPSIPTISPQESDTSTLPDSEKQSAILTQLMEIKESVPDIEAEDLATPPETPPPSPPPKEPTPVIEKEVVKRKPILKLVSTAVVVQALVQSEPTPPPPLPLPQFILQFEDLDWYKLCFPELSSENFGKPCTVENFVELLLDALKNRKLYDIKTGIVAAIMLLLQQEGFDAKLTDLVLVSILTELNKPGGEPASQKSPDQMEFIKKCLQLLLTTKVVNPIVVSELMVQFILASPAFRKEIQKMLEELGLQDSKEYFPVELHTFDVSLVIPSQQKNKLNELSLEWLSTWIKKLRQHISALTGKIARASKGTNLRRGTIVPERPKGILKTDRKKKDSIQVNTIEKNDRSITFVSDNFVGEAAKHVSPIDAINYFCEMRFEEELERLRQEALHKKTNSSNKDRNTILSLPKVGGICSLVRLGETHRSVCHPERETSLARVLPPANWKHGLRSLLLHVNTLKLAPFHDELDDLIYTPTTKSDLVTLRYRQKYFVPASSLVDR